MFKLVVVLRLTVKVEPINNTGRYNFTFSRSFSPLPTNSPERLNLVSCVFNIVITIVCIKSRRAIAVSAAAQSTVCRRNSESLTDTFFEN